MLENRSGVEELVGLTFESNAPVSHRIRQDVGSYISLATDGPGSGGAHQAAVKAEADCASIHTPVAPGYG